jgi:hypothetical protein
MPAQAPVAMLTQRSSRAERVRPRSGSPAPARRCTRPPRARKQRKKFGKLPPLVSWFRLCLQPSAGNLDLTLDVAVLLAVGAGVLYALISDTPSDRQVQGSIAQWQLNHQLGSERSIVIGSAPQHDAERAGYALPVARQVPALTGDDLPFRPDRFCRYFQAPK